MKIRELGFGTKSFKDTKRLVNQDGSFNVVKTGGSFFDVSLYHWLINLSWLSFLGMLLAGYAVVNIIFALIYYFVGVDGLNAEPTVNEWDAFLQCFYFSCQTVTTVGYGYLSPVGKATSLVAAFESFVGLMSFALATGILYGRFSKAKANILFSENMVVSPYRGIKGLKFRIVNKRKNHLIEMQATVMYSYLHGSADKLKRVYKQLDLEIDFINLFPLPWTIVHPIVENSPLHNKGVLDLSREEAEFIVLLKGYDETFNQYVHQAFSYRHDEVIFDADFEAMFDTAASGNTEVKLDKIGAYRKTL
jgi:inward rectifier potassium channel